MQLYRLLEDKFSSKKDVKYGSKGDIVCELSKHGDVLIVVKIEKKQISDKEIKSIGIPTGERFSIKRSLLQKI